MLTLAERQGLGIVTTAKDMARLKSGHGRSAELAQKAAVLNVELEFDPPDLPDLLIRQTVEAFKKRQLTKAGYARQLNQNLNSRSLMPALKLES